MREPADTLGRQAKINVLLSEYTTLREEILTRVGHRWQMLGLVGAILAFVATQGEIALAGRAFLAYAGVVAILVLWLRSGQYLAHLSTRAAEIERHVNELAGDTLMAWESRSDGRLFSHLMSWISSRR